MVASTGIGNGGAEVEPRCLEQRSALHRLSGQLQLFVAAQCGLSRLKCASARCMWWLGSRWKLPRGDDNSKSMGDLDGTYRERADYLMDLRNRGTAQERKLRPHPLPGHHLSPALCLLLLLHTHRRQLSINRSPLGNPLRI